MSEPNRMRSHSPLTPTPTLTLTLELRGRAHTQTHARALWGTLLHLSVVCGSLLYRQGSGISGLLLEGLGGSCTFTYLSSSH